MYINNNDGLSCTRRALSKTPVQGYKVKRVIGEHPYIVTDVSTSHNNNNKKKDALPSSTEKSVI